MQTLDTIARDEQEFVDYVWSFYGPDCLYHEELFANLTKEEIAAALKVVQRLDAFEHDTFGREITRDFLLYRRGVPFNELEYAHLMSELMTAQSEQLAEEWENMNLKVDRVLDEAKAYLETETLPPDDLASRINALVQSDSSFSEQLLYNVRCLELEEEDQADLLNRAVKRECSQIVASLEDAGAITQLEFLLSQSDYDVAHALEKIMAAYWGRQRARRTRVGSFEVVSPELTVLDPVQPPLGEPNILTAVRQGQWTGGLYQCNEKGIGVVNAGLIAYHEDAKFFALNDATWIAETAKVAVTSSLVGIFDRARPEEWETDLLNRVAESETHVAIAASGIASGEVPEGEYIVHVARDEEERVIGVGLIFVRFAETLSLNKVVNHFRGLENKDYPARLLYTLRSNKLSADAIDALLNRSVRNLALSQVDGVLESDAIDKAEYLVGALDFATALSELVAQAKEAQTESESISLELDAMVKTIDRLEETLTGIDEPISVTRF